MIPENDKKQRLTNILPWGRHRFPIVYPETTLLCGLCGAGPFTFGSMAKHMNCIGDGCRETSTNLPVESASEKKSIKKVKVTEKKVQEENKENTTPTSAVFRSEPEKKEKKVEKRHCAKHRIGPG